MTTRVLILNSLLPNANWHLITSLWRECGAEGGDVVAEVAQAHTLPMQLRAFAPDVVIAFGGEALTPEQVRGWRALTPQQGNNPSWVLWTTEDPFELEANQAIAPCFDHVFTSDRASRERYDHPRCHYLPLAADPALSLRPVVADESALWYDLVFVGTAWPNRLPFLADVARAARDGGLRARFLLPTNPHLSAEMLGTLGMEPFEYDMRISPVDLASLQNRSRCALLLFRDFSRFTREPRPQTSPTNRFYETALTGCVQIAVSEQMDVAAFYPELSGAVLKAQTVEGVVEMVRRSRADNAWRVEAAERAQRFVAERHLYRHRVREVLETVRKG